jgi:predicted dehydrogenase
MAEGLPTLLEKPIATTVAEGRTLVDVVKRTGARGSLSVPTMRLKTYPSAADSSWWKPFDCSVVPMTRQDPLLPQMAHFGAVVRGEVAPLVSARDGLQNLQVTESIVEAARSERLVELG